VGKVGAMLLSIAWTACRDRLDGAGGSPR